MNMPSLCLALLGFAVVLMAAAPGGQRDINALCRVPPPVSFTPGPEYGSDARKYQGIPSIERAANGRLWAVWYAGKVGEDRYNYIVGVTSGDDGKTWSDLKFVIDPDGDGPLRASDPCPWIDPDGKLWLFWCQNGGGAIRALFAMTTGNPGDENPTWSTPRLIDDGVMMCKPIVTSAGEWLLPTAIWPREKSCRIVASNDRGGTWQLRGVAGVPDPKDRNCDEPVIVERMDGSLWMLVRTMYGIGETVSTDAGRTWTPIAPTEFAHPAARIFLRRLTSGNLLLVKHGPLAKRTGRTHLTAYVSDDDGKSWRGGLMIDERATVSYPDGVQAPNGEIYIIYDWNRADDKHVLMATFTEDDVLAGKPVSGKTRLRVLINHATGVNPKPWLKDPRRIRPPLSNNEDGVPLVAGPSAKLAPVAGEVRTVELSKEIFSDRKYAFYAVPKELLGKRFVLSSIDRSSATCREAGMVYVLTPARRRNRDSAVDALTKQGFAKAALREGVLFLSANGGISSGNVCTVYQKRVEAGERIEFGKWGVVVF